MRRDLTQLATDCALEHAPAPERRQGRAGIWTFVRNLPQGFVTARLEGGDEMEFPFGFWRQMPLVTPLK